MNSLEILILNCQGLRDIEKRRDVFNYLKQKKHHIYCLQDTHFTKNIESYVTGQWGYKCFFNSFSNNSRGVAILMNNNFDFEISKQYNDEGGNLIILNLKIENEAYTLVNLYGPNQDKPCFYEHLFLMLDEFGKIIICGDLNLVLNPNIDTENYRNINNPKARQFLIQQISSNHLHDIFRTCHPNLRKYTWKRKNPLKLARLDYILVSENLLLKVDKVKIDIKYRSDHSPVILHLKLAQEKVYGN
ncbi:hypothetical protein LOTGIDRAFT_143124 [Lottia gigantea]|uniref:exodeoxyribonuclease III n=1 Tax=Lottia gigantea TaxID=225164 RepID=V4ALV1_LOTGI|nr:hypothetical protein LOTGIDRAFT_143124 [Lottia gigantea]ESO98102.1 hypothetical protein LOTGIDRAFT_143124 [Lottia gigantea]